VSSQTDAAEAVAAAIAGWRGGGLGECAQVFARGVVAPATPGRARALLFAAARLANEVPRSRT